MKCFVTYVDEKTKIKSGVVTIPYCINTEPICDNTHPDYCPVTVEPPKGTFTCPRSLNFQFNCGSFESANCP